MAKRHIPNTNDVNDLRTAFGKVWDALGEAPASASTAVSKQTTSTVGASSGSSGVSTSGSTTTINNTIITAQKGRKVVTATTASLAPGETANLDLTFSESCDLISITTTHDAWVRVYGNSASRTADSSRLIADDPLPGHGIFLDVLTVDPSSLSINLSPAPFFSNGDSTLATTAYVSLTNKTTSYSGVIDIAFTVLPQEQSTGSGPQGPQGIQGATGATGPMGSAGPGVPAGGTVNQLLAKIDATDYNNHWIDAPVSLPTGGTTGQVLAKLSSTNNDVAWVDEQVLTSTYTIFDPDKPPASPSALDDEFNDASTSGNWTAVGTAGLDVANINTAVQGRLYASKTSYDTNMPAFLKAIPTGPFTIFTKVTLNHAGSYTYPPSGEIGAGLVITDNATDLLGTQEYVMAMFNGVNSIGGMRGSANMWGRVATNDIPIVGVSTYLRITRDSSGVYTASTSPDGVHWSTGTAWSFDVGYTETHFGIVMYSHMQSSGLPVSSFTFDFFRYFPTSTAVLGGTRTLYST